MPTKRNVIAVTDDNIGILGPMSRLLSAFGYDTELYASAKEFLDEWCAEPCQPIKYEEKRAFLRRQERQERQREQRK